MSDPVYTSMTPTQAAALITPAMATMMTAAMQTQHQGMRHDYFEKTQPTDSKMPTDGMGRVFSRFANCVVQQPPAAQPQLPSFLTTAQVTVVSTSGERVKVRYLNGEEREFHKTELGVR